MRGGSGGEGESDGHSCPGTMNMMDIFIMENMKIYDTLQAIVYLQVPMQNQEKDPLQDMVYLRVIF